MISDRTGFYASLNHTTDINQDHSPTKLRDPYCGTVISEGYTITGMCFLHTLQSLPLHHKKSFPHRDYRPIRQMSARVIILHKWWGYIAGKTTSDASQGGIFQIRQSPRDTQRWTWYRRRTLISIPQILENNIIKLLSNKILSTINDSRYGSHIFGFSKKIHTYHIRLQWYPLRTNRMDYYHDDSYPIPEYLRQFKNIYCDI